MKDKELQRRKQNFYDSFVAGIFGGFVTGIPLFAYSFLLNLGWSIIPALIAFILSFFSVFLLSNHNIERRFKTKINSKEKFIKDNQKSNLQNRELNLGIIGIKVGIGSLIVSIALSMLSLGLEFVSPQNVYIIKSFTLFIYALCIALLLYLFFKIKTIQNKKIY